MSICQPCPFGSLCTNVANVQSVQQLPSMPGYWRTETDLNQPMNQPVFYACPMPEACPSSPNGTCTAGYLGVLCGSCASGYHLTAGACLPCKAGGLNLLLPILSAGLIIIIVVLFFVSRYVNTRTLVSVLQVCISWIQVMGSTGQNFSIPWPPSFQNLLSVFRVAMLDVWQVRLAYVFVCVFDLVK